ncbi:HTH-type transcriptional regulator KipR [Achromobacter veterisilvae]|uniref:HTH-type transcriptional regulator KipR n=1 Tax=Achromobacter veterisilvae TaxID=2069367 RepID=A0A446CZM2_9BURK|nr:HTH-type transcriptional regulator KipR [Achromobacter veterisilvae]
MPLRVAVPRPSSPVSARRPVRGGQSIGRALGLLRLLGVERESGVELRELVAQSGLDRTTAYRMLATLVSEGFAHRDLASGTYRLGLEAMGLGLAALAQSPLTQVCVPLMKALARRSDEHVFLVARCGDYSHCLHLEEGPRPIRSYADHVGGTRLLGLGIPSFALLAQWDDERIGGHFARHQRQYEARGLSLPKLLRWIRQARAQGYAQVSGQGAGGVGLAFAVGTIGTAALGIVAPAHRMPRSRGAELARAMEEELRRFEIGPPR